MYIFTCLDLVPYILLVLIVLLSALMNRKYSGLISFLSVFIFSGFRYNVGFDYPIYYEIISSSGNNNWEWISGNLAYLANKLDCVQLFFIVNSFIALYPIYWISKKCSTNSSLVILAYLLIPLFYIESLSIVRNASAYSILLLASYFYINNEKKKSIIFLFIATGFHSSAWVGIVLFALLYVDNFSRKLAVIIYTLACVFMFLNLSQFLISFLSPILPSTVGSKLSIYADLSIEQGRFMKFILFLIGALNLLFYKKMLSVNYRSELYIFLYNIGLFIWAIFSFDNTLSLRLSSFYLIFLVLLVPEYCKIRVFNNKLKIKPFVLSFLIVYFSSSFIVNINAYKKGVNDRISILPYQTIFSK